MAHPSHERATDASAPENPYVASTPPEGSPSPRPRRARLRRLALPAAAVATAASVTIGGIAAGGADEAAAGDDATAGAKPGTQAGVLAASASIGDIAARRVDAVSRGGPRQADDPKTLADNPNRLEAAMGRAETRVVTARVVGRADTKRWTTTDLNIWTLPGDRAKKLGLLGSPERVLVTGRERYGRQEVVLGGNSRWVTSGYLAAEKPKPPPPPAPATPSSSSSSSSSSESSGSSAPSASSGACTNGTSVSSGVSPNVAAVHEAVCGSFPEITSYGDFRGDGEHAQGIALDIMVSGDRGWQVAEYVRANASQLGVSYVIYSQQIWSVERSGEGWRGMEDRGSSTANHYDHVHVTTY